MRLDSPSFQQLHQAFVDAFRTQGELKQLARFGLATRLEEITSSQTIPEIIFELIDWAEARGHVPDLVNAACGLNKNPEFHKLVKQAMDSLTVRSEIAISTSEQSLPARSTSSTNGHLQEIATGKQRKRYRKTSKNDNKQEMSNKEVGTPHFLPPVSDNASSKEEDQLSYKTLQLAHRHIDTARKAIQMVIDLIQPEKDVYSDQCQIAVLKVKDASSAIQKIPVLPVHVASHYLLLTEQAYFYDEIGKVVVYFHRFSNQMLPLPLRKDIWDKLHRLMKSLQELDNLIDAIGERVSRN